jgi:hypothetical protein
MRRTPAATVNNLGKTHMPIRQISKKAVAS